MHVSTSARARVRERKTSQAKGLEGTLNNDDEHRNMKIRVRKTKAGNEAGILSGIETGEERRTKA